MIMNRKVFIAALAVFIVGAAAECDHENDDEDYDESVLICRKKSDEGLPLSGRRGLKGDKGDTGGMGPPGMDGISASNGPWKSCEAVKQSMPSAPNGIYYIKDAEGSRYATYCDMTTAGGGWTLVASVHENFMAGKCTTGDRWSSEHGNNAAHPDGDGNWENTRIFGAPESAASDDYKNPGYFNMLADNVMIWHVPNNTPMKNYEASAFMMYRTNTGFMKKYGNLQRLFSDHFPLRHNKYFLKDNGPAIPVIYDKGNNHIMEANTAPNLRKEVDPGFIQFRVMNHERSAFALCPGFRMKATFGNSEHGCIGGTSAHGESHRQCGDFAAKDWEGYATGNGWSSNKAMTESVVMIFYR